MCCLSSDHCLRIADAQETALPCQPSHWRKSRAFTLVEMLAVLVVIGILLAAVVPSIRLMAGRSFSGSVNDIASTFEQARAYAMANNTYVYVGIYEADASQPTSVCPQAAGTGRVYLAVAQYKDGTSGYSGGQWSSGKLASINRMLRFASLHTVPVTQVPPTLPRMDATPDSGDVDLSAKAAQTTFSGTDLGMSATINPVSRFSWVIQFSPAGSANVVTSLPSPPSLPPYIQLAFMPTRGTVASKNTSDCAGLQIDGVTGLVDTFQVGQQ